MKRYLLGTVAALCLSAGVASAQPAAEQVAEQLTAQGYTDVEVRQVRETGQVIHVEAVRDGVEYQYLYNAVTGEILEQEARPVGEGDEDDDDETSDDDDGSQGGGFDRGDDGDHGHGNSGGYDEDNPGRSHGEDEDRGRSDRGKDGNRGQGHGSGNDDDNSGRGRDKGDED